ncbi:hypothetical protein [Candidatus Hecatella orcuttiae]|jgi:hypothetical protein|uniref:hypothetical protein n=1 Tax=Candidatus Hecatella orcuttiae TaxID=1935119 RepID=UPI002867E42C|nr:hypothetical protein [Candidatus Hecatella orcuttiae]
MVKRITRTGIKLAFMGKDKFIELMRAGLGYDRATRTFYIEDLENFDRIKALLVPLLGEEVEFAQTCYLCGAVFPCGVCEYAATCPSRDIPTYCLCKKCYSKTNLYQRYIQKTKEELSRIG